MEDNNLKECWKEIHTGTEISDTQEALSYHFPNLTSSENVDLFICHPAGILRSCQYLGYDHHGKRLDLPMGRKCLSAVSAGFGHWTLSAPHKVSRHIFTERIRSNAQKTAGTKNQY